MLKNVVVVAGRVSTMLHCQRKLKRSFILNLLTLGVRLTDNFFV